MTARVEPPAEHRRVRLPRVQADALRNLSQGAAHVANQSAYLALLKKGLIAKRVHSPWLCNLTQEGRAALARYDAIPPEPSDV